MSEREERYSRRGKPTNGRAAILSALVESENHSEMATSLHIQQVFLHDDGCILMGMNQPFQFKDRRQERIYQGLARIGPGPASFYRDACAMMNEGAVFESQSHLVSHMIREIESALRDVLETVADRAELLAEAERSGNPLQASIRTKLEELNVPENDPVARAWLESAASQEGGSSQHRKEILSILRGLDIPNDDPIAKAWLGLVGKLQGKAHRDSLARPRPVDDAFLKFWDNIQEILNEVLERYERRYLAVYDLLDHLLAKPVPVAEDLELLKNHIPNNLITQRYFFGKLTSPQWLIPLRKKGFFDLPPAPEPGNEEGALRFPYWPASGYLVRVADQESQVVLEIIKSIQTENGQVYDDFAEAALAMPPDKAVKLIPEAKVWLDNPYQFLVGEKLGRLCVRLAQSNQLPAALDLARSLLMPVPAPQAGHNMFFSPEAQPRIRNHDYEWFLEKGVPQIIDVADLRIFAILCDALDEATRLSRMHSSDLGPYDSSYVFRPAIEDHAQNRIRWGLNGVLITTIRDAAERIAKEDPKQVLALVSILDDHPWNVFKRLALHLLRTFPDSAADLIADRLLDRALFEEVGVWHEYGLLARENFGQLKADQQNTILDWLDSGPDIEEWKAVRQTGDEPAPTETEAETYIKRWRIAHIGRLRDVLPVDWRERNTDLFDIADHLNHPDFLSYSDDVSWGTTSPMPADNINGMSIPEIIDYLKGWTPPSNDLFEPTDAGLADTLTNAVKSAPERFAQNASAFQQLDWF